MQFKINKKILINSIQAVSNAISARTVVPILTGMKLDVRNNSLVLTGSNSDITIQSHIPNVKDEQEIITQITPGSIVLPVPHFPEIIKKLPEDIVDIKVDENLKTTITSGNAVFTLYGQNSAEYPQIQMNLTDEPIQIKSRDLKTLIRQTVFAVSQMETRPILTGVNIEIEEKLLTFTATDSHRLALRSIELDTHAFDPTNFVVPGNSLQELNKILDDEDGLVNMSFTQNQVLFYTDEMYFLSRLLSGNYPETARLIPTESKTTLHIFTKDFIHTIERAALLSNRDKNNVIRLDTLNDQTIEISGNSPEIGNVKEQLNIISMEGEDVKITFSSRYMLDTLKTIDSNQVKIDFSGAMRPFVIRSTEQDKILQLILPVRTF